MKLMLCLCLGILALLTFNVLGANASSPPADPKDWQTASRGHVEEIQYLHNLISQAKAHGQPINPEWVARLQEIETPLPAETVPVVSQPSPVEPAPGLIQNPYSPLEDQIRELELQLSTSSASEADRPQITEELKAQLGTLYAQRPENRNNPLDQGGDNCAGITVISGLPFSDTGTTTGRTDDFQTCGPNTAPDVIYRFTATFTGAHTFSLCGSTYDTRLEVRTSGSCPGTTQVGCNDDYCGLQSYLSLNLTAGTTYYVIVDGFGSNSGSYYLNIHDNCDVVCGSNPTECIETPDSSNAAGDCDGGCNNATYGGTNQFATILPGQSVCGQVFTYVGPGGAGFRDTDWYEFSIAQQCTVRWSAVAEYPLEIDIFNASCPATVMAQQFTGACVPATAQAVLAPGTYHAWIGTSFFSPGAQPRDYVATLTASPSGCRVDGSILAPGSFTGNTCSAGNDCALRSSTDQTVQVTIPSDGTWRFSLCGGTVWDSYIYLTSTCCGTVIAQDDDSCGGVGLSTINSVCLNAGVYYLTVEAFSSACGPYTLTVTPRLGSCCYGDSTNPQCQDGISSCLCAFVSGTWHEGLTCAETDCGPRRECQDDAGYGQLPFLPTEAWNGRYSDENTPFVFYENFSGLGNPVSTVRFWGHGSAGGSPCVEQPQAVTISFHPDSLGWPRLANPPFQYTLLLTGTFIGNYSNMYPVYEFTATLPTPANMTTGWISIRGKLGTPSCDFGWLQSPQGDGTCKYTTNGVLGTEIVNLAFCLGTQAVCPDPLPPPLNVSAYTVDISGTRHIQLTWTAPNAGTYEIWSTQAPNNDGDPNGGLDPQWSREDRVYVSVSAGTQIWVDPNSVGSSPAYKNYVILQACRPPNDECANAIATYNGLTTYSNNGADSNSPAPSCGSMGSDVWFRYTATCTGNVNVNTCGSAPGYDTVIEIFGGPCGSLGAPLACDDDGCGYPLSSATFAATSGTTYLIRVGGWAGSQGTALLSVSCP